MQETVDIWGRVKRRNEKRIIVTEQRERENTKIIAHQLNMITLY